MKKEKQSLVILHAHNTLNNGSFMMLINTIWYLNNKMKERFDTHFYVELSTQKDLTRLKKELPGFNNIKLLPITPKLDLKNNSDLYKNFFIENGIQVIQMLYFLITKKPQAIVILGGDDLSEYYASWRIIFRMIWIYIYAMLSKVFIIGQTIGPFFAWRKNAARFFFKDIDVLVRDSLSYKYAKKELKLSKVQLFSDLAFMQLPAQKKNKMYYKKLSLQPGKYITIVPSGIPQHYTKDTDSYISNWVTMIEKIMNEYPKFSIVLLPHVIGPPVADDRNIIRQVVKTLDNKKIVIQIDDELLPSEARSILINGAMTITCRMHASISSFYGGTPAIALSYSVKYDGIIKNDMDCADLVIDANKTADWEKNKVAGKVLNVMKKVLSNPEKYSKKIKEKVVYFEKRGHEQLEVVVKGTIG